MARKNYFVSYDLHAPGQNYEAVVRAIKELGAWAKVHYSLWYLSSDLTLEEIRTKVWLPMDANDRLIVVDASNNAAAWNNLQSEVSTFIRENWSRS